MYDKTKLLQQLRQRRLSLVLGVVLSLAVLAVLLVIISTRNGTTAPLETEQTESDTFSFRLLEPEDYALSGSSAEKETHSVQMTGCTPVEIAQLPFTEASAVEVAFLDSRVDPLIPELEKFTDLVVVAGGDGQCVLPLSIGQE